jgi:hypothetical protein
MSQPKATTNVRGHYTACLFLMLLLAAISSAAQAETPAEKAERMKWWTDARFGMCLHWGPVSLKGTEIDWSRGTEVPSNVVFSSVLPKRSDRGHFTTFQRSPL